MLRIIGYCLWTALWAAVAYLVATGLAGGLSPIIANGL